MRWTMILPLLPAATPAEAQTATADQVIADQRAQLQHVLRPCERSDASSDEIVVCGRGADEPSREARRQALPFGVIPIPGERPRLVAGEAPSARDALAADHCIQLCQGSVGIELGTAIRGISNAIDHLFHGD